MNQLAYAISRRFDGKYSIWARTLRTKWLLVKIADNKDEARRLVHQYQQRRYTALRLLAAANA